MNWLQGWNGRMRFSAILKGILVEGVVTTPVDRGKNQLVLREDPADMTVTIIDGPTEMVALRLKSGACRIGLLGEYGPWNLSCDYILFGSIDSEWYAILVELKKKTGRDDRGYKQLKWSRPVLEYLMQICELNCGHTIDRPIISYALLAEGVSERLDKQRAKAHHPQSRIVTFQGIKIRELIGNRFRLRDLVA